MTGTLICLTGLDGSGKTTVSRHVAEELTRSGRRTSYVYGRYKPVLGNLARSAGKALFFRRRRRADGYVAYERDKKAAFSRRPLVRRVYPYVLLSEYVVQIWLKIGLRLLAGRNVVSDRYLYDTILTDIAKDLSYTPDEAMRLLGKVMWMVPRPRLVILLQVPVQVSMRRKDDIPDVSYLLELQGYYERLAKELPAAPVAGDRPLGEVQADVLRRVGEVLRTENGSVI